MLQAKLEVQQRNTFGKQSARDLRKEGGVPAVLYGRAQDTVSIQIDARSFRQFLRTYGENVIINMEIGNGNTEAIQFYGKSGSLRHIGEGSVLVVSIESHRLPVSGWVSAPILTVHQQNILPAIVVVVNKRTARSDLLRKVLSAKRTGIVDKIDSRLPRNIDKLRECFCRDCALNPDERYEDKKPFC